MSASDGERDGLGSSALPAYSSSSFSSSSSIPSSSSSSLSMDSADTSWSGDEPRRTSSVVVPIGDRGRASSSSSSRSTRGRKRDSRDAERRRTRLYWVRIFAKASLYLGLCVYIIVAIHGLVNAAPTVSIVSEEFDRLDMPAAVVCPTVQAFPLERPSCLPPAPVFGFENNFEQTPWAQDFSQECTSATGLLQVGSDSAGCIAVNVGDPVKITQGNVFPLIAAAEITVDTLPPGSLLGAEIAFVDPSEINLSAASAAVSSTTTSSSPLASTVEVGLDAARTLRDVADASNSRIIIPFGTLLIVTVRETRFEDIDGKVTKQWDTSAANLGDAAGDLADLPGLSFSEGSLPLMFGIRLNNFRVETTKENSGANVVALLGEIGGMVGLLLGASLLSLCDAIVDFADRRYFRE